MKSQSEKKSENLQGKSQRKSEQKDLTEMTPAEKKNFLQNDLIERMIRIEQTVYGNIGQSKKHNETEFYKCLSDEEKRGFNRHLNRKKRKGVGKLLLLIAPLAIFGLMRFSVTGNAIRETTGAEPYWWGWVALGIFILFGVYMWTSYILRRRMERRLRGHEKDLVKRLSKK